MALDFAVDLGGTSGRVGVVDASKPEVIIDRETFTVTQHDEGSPGDFALDFHYLKTAITLLVRRVGEYPQGIGLALAGNVNKERSMLTAAGNLGHWCNYPVARELSRSFDCPVVLGNDAEASARAEALYGHGVGEDFISCIWGTGFNGCVVRVASNGDFVAYPSESGHIKVKPNSSVRCGCGQLGCLEAFVGGKNMPMLFDRRAEELNDDEWQAVEGNLAIGVQNLVVTHLTHKVIFSGGIACKRPHSLERVQKLLEDSMRITDAPAVMLSAFGEDAGLVGAATLLDLA